MLVGINFGVSSINMGLIEPLKYIILKAHPPSRCESPDFSESQSMAILKEADADMKVAELCRKRGISDATSYNWKSQYGAMDASELKRNRE